MLYFYVMYEIYCPFKDFLYLFVFVIETNANNGVFKFRTWKTMKTYSKCTVSLNLVAVSVVDWARLGGVNISLDLNTGHCPGHLDTSLLAKILASGGLQEYSGDTLASSEQ